MENPNSPAAEKRRRHLPGSGFLSRYFHVILIPESQNSRLVGVGRDLKDHPQPHGQGTFHHPNPHPWTLPGMQHPMSPAPVSPSPSPLTSPMIPMEFFFPLFLVDGQVEPPKQDVSSVCRNPCANLIPKKLCFHPDKNSLLVLRACGWALALSWNPKGISGKAFSWDGETQGDIFSVGLLGLFFLPINHEDLPLSVLKRSRVAGNFGCARGISTSLILEKVMESQVGGPQSLAGEARD